MESVTWLWIPISLVAAAIQAVRTAGQKYLTGTLSANAATLVRFLFGLPFVGLYFGVLVWHEGTYLPAISITFIGYVVSAGISQIIATALLLHLFKYRNFAVGTAYVRTEVLLTAVLGAGLFEEFISPQAWVAILVSGSGVLALNKARARVGGRRLTLLSFDRPAFIGIGAGLFFAYTSLAVRHASLSLNHDNPFFAACFTLLATLIIQTFILGGYLAWREPGQYRLIGRQWKVALFVGVTSALGSIGWFTAMTLERAALVKALGQIEFLFAIALSTWFFGERILKQEFLGIALVAGGVLILLI